MSGMIGAARSPYADAWLRLKKNKMAMLGLVAVSVMGLSAMLAGFAPFDAQYGFTWIGATPPLSTHPDILNKNAFKVGEKTELRPGYQGAKKVVLTVNRTVDRKLQVEFERVRDGEQKAGRKIVRIKDGGKEVPYPLTLSEGQYMVVYDRHAQPTKRLTSASLAPGQAAPVEVFGESPEWKVVVHVGKEIPDETFSIDLDGKGVVTKIDLDGQSLQKTEVSGIVVRRVEADGVERRVRHYLGTDLQGRDLYSRILYGGRISLLVGLIATVVSLLIGVIYGAVSGFYGGKVDAFMMAVVDVLYGIPYMFLVILLLVNFGRDILILFIALGAVQWLTMARIVRGQVLSLKQKEFVEAARMSGTSDMGILFNHLIPNTLGVVVVYTTLTVPAVILQESFLAFIGLAVTYQGQNLDSWGALVKNGSDALGAGGGRWWLLIWPSLAMAVTLFSLNFLGDGLRDALDPSMRGKS